MSLEEIRELINLVMQTGVAELELQRGENRVRIRRSPDIVVPPAPAAPVVAAPLSASAPIAGMPAAALPAPLPSSGAKQPVSDRAEAEEENLIPVKSPIVGTFYGSPSPGAPPFVKPGDTVQPGRVLCIIESMKLMNEIEAETAGVIVNVLAESGKPVEYGQTLFTLRPL